MILLNSYLYRDELAAIIERWLRDRPDGSDALRVKQIINYNALLTRLYLRDFAEELLAYVFGVTPESQAFSTTGEVKDFITSHPAADSPRVRELIAAYRDNPVPFYRETPANGRLYFAPLRDRVVCLATLRIKRFRRVAEKGSRRIIDFIYQQICAHADCLAEQRAAERHIAKEALISTADEMAAEFARAERRILDELRQGSAPEPPVRCRPINDVAGMKVIGDEAVQQRVLDFVVQHPRSALVEREVHAGNYNAVNLIIRLRLDKDALLRKPLPDELLARLTERGLSPHSPQADYARFLRQGEDCVQLEVILVNPAELLESEIGRCMHEDRILRQRQTLRYQGHLARNVEHLLSYLFYFAHSPQQTIADLPFKIWGQYMDDYVDQVVRNLFDIGMRRLPF